MIYCAFDPLNIPKDPNTNEDIHICKNYGSFLCAECQVDTTATVLKNI